MREGFDGYPKGIDRTPDPKRFVESTGREIEGLPSRPEQFSRLSRGEDFVSVATNEAVHSDRPIDEFIVFINPKKGTDALMVHAPHWRSVTIPHQGFSVRGRQRNSRLKAHFYEANVKGSGFLKPTLEAGNFDEYDAWQVTKDNGQGFDDITMTLGMASRQDFMRGSGVLVDSQHLFEQGLRCELYWGVVELKNVPYKGELTPVGELKRKGVIHDTLFPAEAVRLFRTNTRIEEALESSERRVQIFTSAFETFNRETVDEKLSFPKLDIANPEHQKIWFREFLRRMGKNLAVLINTGSSHSHLHSSNITMAAEIADLESLWDLRISSPGFKNEHAGVEGGVNRLILKDMRDVAYSCRALVKAGRVAGLATGEMSELAASLKEGFLETFKPKTMRPRGIPVQPKAAEYWLDRIMDKALVRNQRLISLLKGEVSDWGIPFPSV